MGLLNPHRFRVIRRSVFPFNNGLRCLSLKSGMTKLERFHVKFNKAVDVKTTKATDINSMKPVEDDCTTAEESVGGTHEIPNKQKHAN